MQFSSTGLSDDSVRAFVASGSLPELLGDAKFRNTSGYCCQLIKITAHLAIEAPLNASVTGGPFYDYPPCVARIDIPSGHFRFACLPSLTLSLRKQKYLHCAHPVN